MNFVLGRYLNENDVEIFNTTWMKFEELEESTDGSPAKRDGKIPIWKLRSVTRTFTVYTQAACNNFTGTVLWYSH